MVTVKESKLYRALQKHCQTINPTLNSFSESLDCLVDPEFRWKYWFDLIREAMMREDQENNQKAAHFAKLLIENVTEKERYFIGRKIGLNNRKFADDFGNGIIKAFGKTGEKLLNYSYNEFVENIQETYSAINER